MALCVKNRKIYITNVTPLFLKRCCSFHSLKFKRNMVAFDMPEEIVAEESCIEAM
jgi:hypothetical protein